jgi:hypothetical protein|nr:hypothetical protein [Neorhizobium tomejilense]
MTWHTIRYDIISDFKQSWPCHGLPDDFDSLSVETAENGDLVDIEAYVHHEDGTDELLEWREFDGPALSALVQDCIKLGDISDMSSPRELVPAQAASPTP